MSQGERAFTLVELLIVVVVLAILAAIAIPWFADASQRSKAAAVQGQLKLLNSAVHYFYNDTGLWPKKLNDLDNSSAPPNGVDATGHDKPIPSGTYHGPYISTPVIPTSFQKFISYNGPAGIVTYDATGSSPADAGALPR